MPVCMTGVHFHYAVEGFFSCWHLKILFCASHQITSDLFLRDCNYLREGNGEYYFFVLSSAVVLHRSYHECSIEFILANNGLQNHSESFACYLY